MVFLCTSYWAITASDHPTTLPLNLQVQVVTDFLDIGKCEFEELVVDLEVEILGDLIICTQVEACLKCVTGV